MDLAIKKLPLDWTLRGKWGTVANCLSFIKPSPFLESELRGLLIPSTRISSSSAPLLSSGSPQTVKINKFEKAWTSLNKFGHVWTYLGQFGQSQTSLDQFEQVYKMTRQVPWWSDSCVRSTSTIDPGGALMVVVWLCQLLEWCLDEPDPPILRLLEINYD